MHRITLGIVSDEISLDFNEAVHHATSWGISIFELRMVKSGRIPDIEPGELRLIQDTVRARDLTVSALSPGIFKFPLNEKAKLEHELSDVLPRTLGMAGEFGAPIVIVFGFQRTHGEDAGNFERAVDIMRCAGEKARTEGITLVIENEPGFWCDSGSNTARLIGAVQSAAVRANWDPCNGYGTTEQPYPAGYAAIKKFIANVHVKDTKEGSLIRCVPVGDGAVDWRGQLKAIVRDQTVKHVTIETHCLPLIENSKKNVDVIRGYLEETYAEEGQL